MQLVEIGYDDLKRKEKQTKARGRHFQHGGVALAVLKKIYTLLVVFESVK